MKTVKWCLWIDGNYLVTKIYLVKYKSQYVVDTCWLFPCKNTKLKTVVYIHIAYVFSVSLQNKFQGYALFLKSLIYLKACNYVQIIAFYCFFPSCLNEFSHDSLIRISLGNVMLNLADILHLTILSIMLIFAYRIKHHLAWSDISLMQMFFGIY